MKKLIRIAVLSLILCMLTGMACAENISFTGTVVPAETLRITAPVSGTLGDIGVQQGEMVTAGTVIASVETGKVYAAMDGTVTAVYGQPGDDAESIGTQYGACIYMEGDLLYTVSGNTNNAYNAAANKIIHSGETVFLRGKNDTSHTGIGTVTTVSGTSYTVNVMEGNDAFSVGESLEIFRDPAYASTSRIGRGSTSRVDPTAVTTTGTIISYAVQAGDRVRRGDLLMETAEGTYDQLQVAGTDVIADRDLIIAEVTGTAGTAVSKGETVATAYPCDRMLAEVVVNECDLMYIQPGDQVTVSLVWNQDDEVKYEGTVVSISYIGEIGEENTTYKAQVEFIPDEGTRLNMTAEVTVNSSDPENIE